MNKSVVILTRITDLAANEHGLISIPTDKNEDSRYNKLQSAIISLMSILAEKYDPSITTPIVGQQKYNDFNSAYASAEQNSAPKNALLVMKNINVYIENRTNLTEDDITISMALLTCFLANNEREFKIKSQSGMTITANEQEHSIYDPNMLDSIKIFVFIMSLVKTISFDEATLASEYIQSKSL